MGYRIFFALLAIVIGSYSTILYSEFLADTLSGIQVNNGSIAYIIITLIASFSLVIGQNQLSKIIAYRLAIFFQSTLNQEFFDYKRDDKFFVDKHAMWSSEAARLRGLIGNALSSIISYTILFVAISIKIILDGQYVLIVLLLCALPVFLGINYLSSKQAEKIGIINRKSSSEVSKRVASFISYPELHMVQGNLSSRLNSYKISLFNWLDSIRGMWYLNAFGKYTLEMFSVLVVLMVLSYDFNLLGKIIALIRVLPLLTSLNTFLNGKNLNGELALNFWRSLRGDSPVNLSSDSFQINSAYIDQYNKISSSGVFLLSGNSGIGKTTLIKSLALRFEKENRTYMYLSNIVEDDFLNRDYIISANYNLDFMHDIDIKTPFLELSNGQKQRVLLSSCLNDFSRWNVLFLDEVLSGLDDYNKTLVLNHLITFSKNDRQIILIDHELTNNQSLMKDISLWKIK